MAGAAKYLSPEYWTVSGHPERDDGKVRGFGVELEEKASRLEPVRWNQSHTSFQAPCPMCGKVLAVSNTSEKCLGGCAKDVVAKFWTNGSVRANSPQPESEEPEPPRTEALNGVRKNGHSNGHHPPPVASPDLNSWKLKLYDLASDLIEKASAGGRAAFLAASKPDDLIESVANDLKRACEEENRRVLPLPDLTQTEREEEIFKVASAAIGRIENLPAVHTNGAVPAVIGEYDERLSVDAFDAYTAMVSDKREYSWEGLIRDGCTGIVSALIGSGKSTLAMNLARSWALGVPFLDRECRQSKTLVVVSPKEYEAWADTIGFWQLKGLIFLVESTKAHFNKGEETVRWFDFLMQKDGCRTFVLDTLFDFFGMPPNTTGDSNRIAMNEQTPLLQLVRERNYAGLVTGHAPKSEASALTPRDPEESFGGHTAWTAQHRMRMTIRRKSSGINAFVTGRGGYGDKGILKEQLLIFNEETRIDSLGGLFADHLGVAALPSVMDALQGQGWMSRVDLEKATGKGKSWVIAGLREGQKSSREGGQVIKKTGENRSTRYAVMGEPEPLGKLL